MENILTNRVRITDEEDNVYEGDIVSNEEGLITIRLDDGKTMKFDFSYEEGE